MGSVNRTKIHSFLKNYADGKYSGSGVAFDFDSGRYLVLVPHSVGVVSARASSMLEKRLLTDVGVEADVRMLVGATNEALAVALHKLVGTVLKSTLEDIIVSVQQSGTVDVIVIVNDIADATSDKKRSQVMAKTESLCQSVELSLNDLCFSTVNEDTPSRFQILQRLFILAPISSDDLASSLTDAGHAVPSMRWMERQLDSLMRSKFIQWQDGDEFVATEKGISTMPQSTHRNSPDILRALALAKRQWLE